VAEPTNEQREAIRAYVHGDLVPLIEQVLVKRLGLAAVFMRDKLLAEPLMPTDDEIAAWADGFIREHAYNRPVAVQIATEAAKWVRSRIAGVGGTSK
jgi:hypothetical protein